jgi:hypothetical protein
MAIWQLLRCRASGGHNCLARSVAALTVMLCVIGLGLGGKAALSSLAFFGVVSNSEEAESDSEAKSIEHVRVRPRVCRQRLVTYVPIPLRDMAAHSRAVFPSARVLQVPLHLIGSGIRMLC